MKCKYCPETSPVNFPKNINTVCKACRKKQVLARKHKCPIEGCEKMVCHTATFCGSHAQLARVRIVDTPEMLEVAPVEVKQPASTKPVEKALLPARLLMMRDKNRDLELDLEDERQSRLKLEEELEVLRAERKNNADSLAQVTDLQNEVAELQAALMTMRELYLKTYDKLEVQKKLNKALIAGQFG